MKNILYELRGKLVPGQHMRLEHCVPGKAKLYVSLTQDGEMLLGKCFHCGEGAGVPNSRSLPSAIDPKIAEHSVPQFSKELPDDSYRLKSDSMDELFFPKEGSAMLERWDIPITSKRIHYSPRLRRLLLVAYDLEGERLGWMGRSLHEGHKPKWLSAGQPGYAAYRNTTTIAPRTLVITEDMVSAWHARAATFHGIALLGTSMRMTLLADLCTNYKFLRTVRNIVIWLDNDKPIVKRNAMHILHELEDRLPSIERKGERVRIPVYINTETGEPKELSSSKIRETVRSVCRRARSES